MVEQRPQIIDGIPIPFDLTAPNPNNMEWDNLYIDMNGIIHPCSHPEDRPTPKTEAEMFVNVMEYVDRIFAAVRPRRVLFLAIDGVAPRAKMNQQRTRRFRSAGDARERHEIKLATRQEMVAMGLPVPPEELDKEWDSNVITPGTEFMVTLARYLRFYVSHRINTCKAWQNIKVLFSDGSEPGEGEHKIMDFIRRERAQPGYDPNTRHILHGLDADLIMLALATHEPHFTILREQVFFGRKGGAGREGLGHPKAGSAQGAFDAMQGGRVDDGFARGEGDRFPYLKPFQMLYIPTLREYLREEFRCLEGGMLPFGYDFERVVDDFVFLCFFVGNDFLPHLPSLDIRDGAIDFLLNVYKRVLPAMGDYLTAPGGVVNLEKVDIILAEVGRVEDEVFRRRRAGEDQHKQRLNRRVRDVERRHGGSVQELAARIVPADVQPLGRPRLPPPMVQHPPPPPPPPAPALPGPTPEEKNKKNKSVAQLLRDKLKKPKRENSNISNGNGSGSSSNERSPVKKEEEEGREGGEEGKLSVDTEVAAKGDPSLQPMAPSPMKKIKLETTDIVTEGFSTTVAFKGDSGELMMGVSTEVNVNVKKTEGEVEEGDEENEEEDVMDEEEEEEKEEFENPHIIVPPELEGTDLAAAQKELAERVKSKQEARLDRLKEEIEDTIRYHEAGWKDRYYQDKLKKQNMEKGGGREHMYRTYIEGLCWVFQYYYRGCQAWGWFYPFHYAPFASDLVNIERFQVEFEMGTPLKPLEQLMAVLPPESADALPLPLARLMTSEDSPIKDFYPRDVEVDPNGKAMPWLWVTLLPFIDEKRLLSTITEVENELSLAEKTRNQLGGSLLALHEYHPTFRTISTVIEESKTNSQAILEISAAQNQGFSGTLTKPPADALIQIGAPVTAPKIPPSVLHDVEDNRALIAGFALPPQATPHASILLPGLTHPPRRLSDRDLAPRRPPRLGRGVNIAELGTQFGFMDVHAVAAHRMIVHNMPLGGRGGGGPGGMMYQQHQQQYQQQGYGGGSGGGGGTGTRSWGSFEPHNNQKRRPTPPQLPPPSLYPGVGAGGSGPSSYAPRLVPPMMHTAPRPPSQHFPQPPMMTMGGVRGPYPPNPYYQQSPQQQQQQQQQQQ
eukprot:evm.model.NODE_8251_length_22696_cov_22.787495.3